MQLCIDRDMCDTHMDAMSSLQSALSHGFNIESIRELAKLYLEHSFLLADEADAFLSAIPVPGEHDLEASVSVTDQVLGDPDGDFGDMIPSRPSFDIDSYLKTFTPSQNRAYQWISSMVNDNKQIQLAIVGPAGTGKSYLLHALIEFMRSSGLVISKLAPSGVAAHLIGGTTVHNFFALDIDCNSSLEKGTVQATRLRKTDVIVIDEFSMLDFFLFRTAEGLCRKFAKQSSSRHPWGGRHVILLGDPAQLPAVSRMDVFGTSLWHNFQVLLLREVKRASDPILSSLLSKVRLGLCDSEVSDALKNRLQEPDITNIDLDRTIIICSRRAECDKMNEQCLERLHTPLVKYEAHDTDHNGHPLREADYERIQHCRERLPDVLQLKLGARVLLRRNLDIDHGWVNGTLAVVIALHPKCVTLQKMANPTHRLPVPRVRQKIDIQGASYSILRQQFPMQLAYAVTVHRVQGLTVQKAVVCLNSSFFASGQAYVALSRVRKLEDLVLWEFCPTAIGLLKFYRDLLEWCDCVDVIRPTPPTVVVPFPSRADDISNAPLQNNADIVDPWEADEVDKLSPVQDLKCSANSYTQSASKKDTPSIILEPFKRKKPSSDGPPVNPPPKRSKKSFKRKRTSSDDPPVTPPSKRSKKLTESFKGKRTSSDDPPVPPPCKRSKKSTSTKRNKPTTQLSTSLKNKMSFKPTTPGSSESDVEILNEYNPTINPTVPLPSLEWKMAACTTLEQFTGLNIIDKVLSPEPVRQVCTDEVLPHIVDYAIGDNHCLFRALSKEVTGTQANYRVFRHAAVLFIQSHPELADYMTPSDPTLPNPERVQTYIASHDLLGSGWGGLNEIRAIATLLNLDIYVFCTHGHSRQWIRDTPFTLDFNTPPPSPHALYLFHTIEQNHYNRVHMMF